MAPPPDLREGEENPDMREKERLGETLAPRALNGRCSGLDGVRLPHQGPASLEVGQGWHPHQGLPTRFCHVGAAVIDCLR
jgi:hypothetical protein